MASDSNSFSSSSSSPTDFTENSLVSSRDEPCTNQVSPKIKKPRRLRKQINNDQFKQFYFELKVNETKKKDETVENNQKETTVSSSSSCAESNSLSNLSNSTLKRKKSYEILQFETAQEKDEESLYKERIKNEIKANSHHFCLPNSKKKKTNAKHQQDISQNVNNQQETLPECNNNHEIYQQPINPLLFNDPNLNPIQLTEPVTNQISIQDAELLRTILQLLLNNNK